MSLDFTRAHLACDLSPLPARAAPIWTGRQMRPEDFIHRITSSEAIEIHTALWIARDRHAGKDLSLDRVFAPRDFPLTHLSRRLRDMAHHARHGRGFAVLRGLPTADLSDRDCQLLLRGLAAHLGVIATQSREGHLIRHVRATGESLGNGTVRGHQTTEKLYFHTDGADAAVLLCVRPASTGGLSRLASAAQVHNRMLAIDPSLASELYEPFHFHMAGGNVPGLPPTFISPIFSVHQNLFSCRYVRHTLLETPAITGIPLSQRALSAFDALEELAGEECVDMELQAGDLQIVNNHTILHSRTAYRDTHATQPRHLLRSWLTFPEYEGRRAGLVDEGLRFGWLSDHLQEQIAARTGADAQAGQ